MAQSYKILGQIESTANIETNVYVTPTSTSAIINTIYITNQDSANANVTLIVRPIDESLNNQHYLLKDQLVEAADTLILNLNITLDQNVILSANNTFRAGQLKTCNVSVNAFGVELT